MKKFIATLLAAMMIVSIAALSVSAAPAGTAINTADEFAAMAADGTYYLAADITITAAYANTFTGTFDGNGKTITLGAENLSTFAAIGGTAAISNLTIASTENFKVYVTNGGVAATVVEGANVTVDGCTNTALRTRDTNGGKAEYVGGGILGVIEKDATATVTNCVNSTGVYGRKGASGGIVGQNLGTVVINACVNTGDLKSGDSGNRYDISGGILGDAMKGTATITNCLNTFAINSLGNKHSQWKGGIIGRAGYVNGDNIEYNNNNFVSNCLVIGDADAKDAGGKNDAIAPGYDPAVASTNIKNCYVCDAKSAYTDVVTTVTADKIADGSLVALLNGANSAVWSQSAEQPIPSPKYVAEAAPEETTAAPEESTAAPEETTATPDDTTVTDPGETGDNAIFVVFAIFAVGAIGTAVISRKREQN